MRGSIALRTSLRQTVLDPLASLEQELLECLQSLQHLKETPEEGKCTPIDKDLCAAQILSALDSVEGIIQCQTTRGISVGDPLHEADGAVTKGYLSRQQSDANLVEQMLRRYSCIPTISSLSGGTVSSGGGTSTTCLADGKTLLLQATASKPSGGMSVNSKEAASARFLWSLSRQLPSKTKPQKLGGPLPVVKQPLFAAVDDLAQNFLLADVQAEAPELAALIRDTLPPQAGLSNATLNTETGDLAKESLQAQAEVLEVILEQKQSFHTGRGKSIASPASPDPLKNDIIPTRSNSMAGTTHFPRTLALCRKARAFIRYDPTLAPHRRPTNSAAAVYYAALDALYRDALCIDFVVQLRGVLLVAKQVSTCKPGTPSKPKEGWMLSVLKPIAHMLVQYHTVLSCDLGKTVDGQISALRRLSSSASPPPAPFTIEDRSAFEFALSPFHCTAVFEAVKEAGVALKRSGGNESSSLRQDHLDKVLALEDPLVKYETLVGAVAFLGPMVSDREYFAHPHVHQTSSPYTFLWDDAVFFALLDAFYVRVRHSSTLILEGHHQLVDKQAGTTGLSAPSTQLGNAELLPTLVGLGRIAARTIDQLAAVNALPSVAAPRTSSSTSLGEDTAGEDLVPITLESKEDQVLSGRLQALLSIERSVGSALFQELLPTTTRNRSNSTGSSVSNASAGSTEKSQRQFTVPKSLRRSRFYCPVSGAFMPPIQEDSDATSGTQTTRATRNHPRFLTCGHVIGSKAFQSLTQFSRQRTSGSHPTVGCPYCTKHSTPADSVYLRY